MSKDKEAMRETAKAIVETWLRTARETGHVGCLFCEGHIYNVTSDAGSVWGHTAPICHAFTLMMQTAIPLNPDTKA
jgi:hypothetical protein